MILPALHPFLLDVLRAKVADDPTPDSPENDPWETIIGEAGRHGLIPILYRWLHHSGRTANLPPSVRDRIKADAFRIAARNGALAREAASILSSLRNRQVACAPVRGLALAEMLYGDITARPMGDLDLLVRKADLHAVSGILLELGFLELDRRPGFARTYSNTLEFVKKWHGWIIVEPHWTIAYPPFADRIDMDAVWQRCVRGHVLGVETWLLGREDLLLHLCLHLIHRRDDAPMLWFYELDRLIQQGNTSLDWSQVVRVAREAGQDLFLLEALRQVNRLFRTPIPEQVLAGRTVDNRMIALLTGNSNADGRESLTLLFTIKGARAKIRYILALLFPSFEFMRLHHGLSSRRQVVLCYFRRLTYFAREGFKGLVKLLFPQWTTGTFSRLK